MVYYFKSKEKSLCVFSALNIHLLLRNVTTIESQGYQNFIIVGNEVKKLKTIFWDNGWRENFRNVMGDSFPYWFLPLTLDPKEDGYSWVIDEERFLCE